ATKEVATRTSVESLVRSPTHQENIPNLQVQPPGAPAPVGNRLVPHPAGSIPAVPAVPGARAIHPYRTTRNATWPHQPSSPSTFLNCRANCPNRLFPYRPCQECSGMLRWISSSPLSSVPLTRAPLSALLRLAG